VIALLKAQTSSIPYLFNFFFANQPIKINIVNHQNLNINHPQSRSFINPTLPLFLLLDPQNKIN